MGKQSYREEIRRRALNLLAVCENMKSEGKTDMVPRHGVELSFCDGDERQGDRRVQTMISDLRKRHGYVLRSPSRDGVKRFALDDLIEALRIYAGQTDPAGIPCESR